MLQDGNSVVQPSPRQRWPTKKIVGHYQIFSGSISIGNRAEWSPIWSVIIRVITQSGDRTNKQTVR